MARPKNTRQGQNLTLYLSPKRLDTLQTLHTTPAEALRILIDHHATSLVTGSTITPPNAPPPTKKPKTPSTPPQKPPRACDRCTRIGKPTCSSCRNLFPTGLPCYGS